jgi:hypothetical protein
MRSSSSLILCVITSVLLLAGCASTPQDRISKNRAIYESFPADVQRKISAGQVEMGFTPDMVALALGKPDQKLTRAEAGGETEVWVYEKHKPQFSFGVGMGSANYGSGGGVATGVGVSTSTPPSSDYMRVAFRDGRVSSVERSVGS